MKAGMLGKTENVRIRSLVGRYLEHSRIYCFGKDENLRVYIASGDFLTRNTERRVEVGVRIKDKVLADKLYGLLQLQLRDTVNARLMQPSGSYVKIKPAEGQVAVDSQMAMYGYFNNFWGNQPVVKQEEKLREAPGKDEEQKDFQVTETREKSRSVPQNGKSRNGFAAGFFRLFSRRK